jgi:hypothetical protein
MSKVLATLVALALFAALPGLAFAGNGNGDNGEVASGNEQEGSISQSARAGAGGNAGNQAALIQQNAGEDAIANVNQNQNFNTGGVVVGRGGGDFDNGDNGHFRGHGHGVSRVHGVGGFGGVGVRGGGVGGGLAVTGLDAWVFALAGGGLLAGGLGLLAAQRRGRLSA